MQTDPIGYEDQMNLYAYVHNDPMTNIDPSGRVTIITITRDTYTNDSITGTINVVSTNTDSTFDGFTLEQRTLGNTNLPVQPDVYTAFTRNDHTPNRIELQLVEGVENVQIHNGNDTSDVEGCFAVGTSRSEDWVSNSITAMNAINALVEEDGDDAIIVNVQGGTDPEPEEID